MDTWTQNTHKINNCILVSLLCTRCMPSSIVFRTS
uniref:Uncharacterized protein n=1 Tax=Rhizophora mucronata TaxID=61149 RepID=A0A2P2KWJ2_RHIMU